MKTGPGPENYTKEAMSPTDLPEDPSEEVEPPTDLQGAVAAKLQEAESAGKLDGLKKFLLTEDVSTDPKTFLEAAMRQVELAGRPIDEIVSSLEADPELLQAVKDALPPAEATQGENMAQAMPRMMKAAEEAPDEEE